MASLALLDCVLCPSWLFWEDARIVPILQRRMRLGKAKTQVRFPQSRGRNGNAGVPSCAPLGGQKKPGRMLHSKLPSLTQLGLETM